MTPRTTPAPRTSVALVFLSLFAPVAGWAQGDRIVGETIDVRVVDIDAVVVDKKGRPVRGLGPGDFRILEDGVPVEITHFATFGASPEPKEAASASSPEIPSEVVGAASAPALSTVAIYLDDRGTGLSDRRRVLEDVRPFLATLDQGGPDWILGAFRSRFEVLAGPTRDPRILFDVLAELPSDPRSQEWQLAERRAFDGIRDSYQACESTFCTPCVDNWAEMLAIARGHAASAEQRTTWTLNGLADVIGTLSGLPGRKIVLYVGAGFEQRSGMATFSYLADLCEPVRDSSVQSEIFQTILEYDQTNRIDELTAYANSNRVTLHMLDAAGIHPTRRANVDFADSRFVPSSVNDQVRRDNFQNMHFALANETGGTAILNANRPLQALESLTTEWTTYSLGFTPPHPPTGRSHRIRVELVGSAAKGHRVRHRRSYLDKKLEAELVDRLTSTLFLERDTNPLGVEVAVGAADRLGRNRYEVPIEIRLPRAKFLTLPDSRDPRGQARLWMASVSDRGGRSTVRQTLEDIDPVETAGGDTVEHGAIQQSPLHTVVVRIELERGTHRVAIGVRDEIAHTESLISVAVEVDESEN